MGRMQQLCIVSFLNDASCTKNAMEITNGHKHTVARNNAVAIEKQHADIISAVAWISLYFCFFRRFIVFLLFV